MGNLRCALKPDGFWYLPLKFDSGEREKDRRCSSDKTEQTLKVNLRLIGGLRSVDVWVSEAVRSGRPEGMWFNKILAAS